MRQIAPDPTVLAELVAKIKYKAGWHFTLGDIDRGQGSEGLTLTIYITVPDSYHPEQTMRVAHYMIVPPAAYDEQSWTRWLLDQILLVEQHEACEFFQINGHRPFAPNHGPGRNCYSIFEQGTKEDAQTTFRGERFELDSTDELQTALKNAARNAERK
jgi:hypothetical protein